MICIVISNLTGLLQDCNISIANTLEILQSYSKPSIYGYTQCFLMSGETGSIQQTPLET